LAQVRLKHWHITAVSSCIHFLPQNTMACVQDKAKIEEEQALWNKEYKKLADDKQASGEDATCLAITMQLGYTQKMLDVTPKDAQQGIMCGCPPAYLDLKPGMQCLDLGSGAGTDVILCALGVQGNGGKATGLDILPEMTERAAGNAATTPGLQAGTADFKVVNINEGHIATTFEDNTMDVVTSNCCVCLFVQATVFPTIFNVLKPGGVFCFAESMCKKPFDPETAIYKLFREAYEKGIYPTGRDSACKAFRASIACTHDNPMTPELVMKTLSDHKFVGVSQVAALKHPQGLSPKPLPPPQLTSDILDKAQTEDFCNRFAEAWKDYDVDEHVVYACIQAKKPEGSGGYTQ
jgi:SAM-dependent methyltransferase